MTPLPFPPSPSGFWFWGPVTTTSCAGDRGGVCRPCLRGAVMIVLRSTMDAALEVEREKSRADRMEMVRQYGGALLRLEALQREMSAWVMNKAENITPEQAAQMFYAQDDRWQAAFFNVMQAQVLAYHEAQPPSVRGVMTSPGVPAGEGQWYHMAKHLNREGFETLDAMFDHAKHHLEDAA